MAVSRECAQQDPLVTFGVIEEQKPHVMPRIIRLKDQPDLTVVLFARESIAVCAVRAYQLSHHRPDRVPRRPGHVDGSDRCLIAPTIP